ncbi:MAG: hypothetical protein ACMXYM_03230 [Candidatus Woesearchaeota archaeon]
MLEYIIIGVVLIILIFNGVRNILGEKRTLARLGFVQTKEGVGHCTRAGESGTLIRAYKRASDDMLVASFSPSFHSTSFVLLSFPDPGLNIPDVAIKNRNPFPSEAFPDAPEGFEHVTIESEDRNAFVASLPPKAITYLSNLPARIWSMSIANGRMDILFHFKTTKQLFDNMHLYEQAVGALMGVDVPIEEGIHSTPQAIVINRTLNFLYTATSNVLITSSLLVSFTSLMGVVIVALATIAPGVVLFSSLATELETHGPQALIPLFSTMLIATSIVSAVLGALNTRIRMTWKLVKRIALGYSVTFLIAGLATSILGSGGTYAHGAELFWGVLFSYVFSMVWLALALGLSWLGSASTKDTHAQSDTQN